MTSLKTSIKTITYLSDTGCLEIQGASLYFKKPESLKAVFPSLDNFKYLDKHYVFNVGGNELRVVAMVFFESQKCYIREVMTHKEYDFFTAVHRTKGKK
ncbi:type II toxin-antitoxin system HigB family toxin [Escherichia coli]